MRTVAVVYELACSTAEDAIDYNTSFNTRLLSRKKVFGGEASLIIHEIAPLGDVSLG